MGGKSSKPAQKSDESHTGMTMTGGTPVPNEEALEYAAMNGKKRALLCGCNYAGTAAELLGCVNDVQNWEGLLKDCMGFLEKDITVLIDQGKDGKCEKPTGKNIKDKLKHLVKISKPGDMVFFQFSGHGVQVPADDDDDDYEPDGLDEALCPCDMNLIIDDDLREILKSLKEGVKFTMVSDCCHSGGMLDNKEVIIDGAADEDVKTFSNPKRAREIFLEDLNIDVGKAGKLQTKNRAIDLATMEAFLKDQAKSQGKDGKIDVAEKRTRGALQNLYGSDASNGVKKAGTYVGAGKKPDSGLVSPDKGILITGCQAHETSADVTGSDGRAFGALSHTVTKIVRRHHAKYPDRDITSRELVLKVRKLLNNSGFAQNPCLECSDSNADAKFIVW